MGRKRVGVTYANRNDVVTARARIRIPTACIPQASERVLVSIEDDRRWGTAENALRAGILVRCEPVDSVARVIVHGPYVFKRSLGIVYNYGVKTYSEKRHPQGPADSRFQS
jgi:hypothetical protein